MHLGLGVTLITAGSLLGLLVAFGAWPRLPGPVALALIAACGIALGAGALLVQHDATAVEWVLTLVTLGVLAPVHVRLVFGPPGLG
ncbi:MAG TPA: hypothetical protein VID69_00510 [Actinomycetota bacterium]|jgi:hypothetical protein